MQAQESTATLFNRYPNIFLSLQAYIRERLGDDLGGERCRILSFGCSTGAELLSLRAYFPYAEILGCDINTEALDEAVKTLECDPAVVFHSSEKAIRALGPYDVILANSVLCSYPKSASLDVLTSEFPFSKFCDLAEMLLSVLKEGGCFVLVNSNYFFRDLPSAAKYQPLVSPLIEGNGFVEKFDANSRKVSQVPIFRSQRHYAHKLIRTAAPYTDDDFRHCVFVKEASSPAGLPPNQSATPDDSAVFKLALGGDVNEYASQGLIGAGLYRSIVTRSDGGSRALVEWRKSTVSGAVASLGAVEFASSEAAGRENLTNELRWKSSGAKSWQKRLNRLRKRVV